EVASFLGIDPFDPEAERRAMMLWSFVHGLSFLLIDGKVEAMELDLDLPQILHDMAQRVMVDH
ncbi:MAG: TetR/AcrR family transcriptional regulator, partial [Pseudomonadota bacterium]